MKERIYKIYALIDPRDSYVRYIGITDNISKRFKVHLREAGSRTMKGMWLEDLRCHGLQPIIEILEEVKVEKAQVYIAEERERYWIREFERRGVPLTNVRDTVSNPRKHSKVPIPNYQPPAESRARDSSRAIYTLDQLRRLAGLRVNELADLAQVSETSLRQMMQGIAVSRYLIDRVLRVLSKRLNYVIAPSMVKGLKVL